VEKLTLARRRASCVVHISTCSISNVRNASNNTLLYSTLDPEGFLSQNAFADTDAQLGSVKSAEVAVVVVDSMSSAFVGVDSIGIACERFASQLIDDWGIGDPLLENGVMLLVSIGDR
jgi:uncharacterized membrane protein YgcG